MAERDMKKEAEGKFSSVKYFMSVFYHIFDYIRIILYRRAAEHSIRYLKYHTTLY